MKTWFAIALVGCLPTLVAAESIRCGNQIISRGTSRAEVAALCGQPAQIDKGSSYNGVGPASVEERQIEIWTYNFGPNMLMERIRFEDGIIVDMQSLGYGYNEP